MFASTFMYQEWIEIRKQALSIREELNDPRLRDVAFEYKVNNQYLFLNPRCKVSKPPSNLIGLQVEQRSNILIESQDYYVKVPRDIPEEAFKTRVWVDAVLKLDGKLSGISCRVHYIDDKKGLSLGIVLKQEIEQKRFN